jgi:hypothetical protein
LLVLLAGLQVLLLWQLWQWRLVLWLLLIRLLVRRLLVLLLLELAVGIWLLFVGVLTLRCGRGISVWSTWRSGRILVISRLRVLLVGRRISCRSGSTGITDTGTGTPSSLSKKMSTAYKAKGDELAYLV